MKRLLASLALIGLLSSPALADGTIDTLLGAGAIVGTESVPIFQTANPAVKATASAIGNAGTLTGDATKAASSTAVTLATVNANIGSFGSATTCTAFTTNGKGLITAASAVTCTPAIASVTGLGTGIATALAVNVGTAGSVVVNGGVLGTPASGVATNLTGTAAGLTAGNVTTNANLTGMVTSVGNAASLGSFTSANLAAALTDETGTGANVFGTAPTISSLNATTAVTLAYITGSTQCLHVSTTGAITGTGSDCGAASGISSITPGAGQVSSVTASCSQTAITTSGTISTAECVNAQSGTSYAIVDGDRGKLVTGTNAAAQAYNIAQAGAASAFQSGWFARVQNKGTLTLTITPTTSTINGAASYIIYPNQTIKITSDGTNYQVDAGASGTVAINSQTGANYAIVASDFAKLVNLSNASPQIPTLPTAATVGANWFTQVCNQGAGTQTITPATSTIGGAATYVLRAASAIAPVCVGIVSDGTNYQVVPDAGLGTLSGAVKASGGQLSQAACADLSNGATGCSTATGTSGATLPLLNGANTWSGTQTFGNVVGAVTTQAGTTYTLASTDCGTLVRFSNASAVTVTIPQGLAVGCNIALMQAAAGQVSVNGSAVTPATLQSAHSYTKTFGAGAIIGISTDASNHATLTGDGA